MEDELVKKQLEWISAKVDKMDGKIDRLAERFNLTLGRLLGASAVIAMAASLFVAWMVK